MKNKKISEINFTKQVKKFGSSGGIIYLTSQDLKIYDITPGEDEIDLEDAVIIKKQSKK
jgi:hypothetical protein